MGSSRPYKDLYRKPELPREIPQAPMPRVYIKAEDFKHVDVASLGERAYYFIWNELWNHPAFVGMCRVHGDERIWNSYPKDFDRVSGMDKER